MRFESALTESLRVAKLRFYPLWLCTASSRHRSPGQGTSRVMSDLLTADSKEDGTGRTAKTKRQVVTRSIGKVTAVIVMVAVFATAPGRLKYSKSIKHLLRLSATPCIKESR
jgi:hypothetical protein